MEETPIAHNPIYKIDTHDGKLPEFKEIDDEQLKQMFAGLFEYNKDAELDNLDWSKVNFNVFDENYYREKFGESFPDYVYKILADSTKEENKVLDFRQPPLIIEHNDIRPFAKETETVTP